MKGTVIAAEEVKARWAYAEIASERFGKTYQANLPAALSSAVMQAAPFAQVAQSDWPILIDALKKARNSPGFIDNIDTVGAPQYECVEWHVADLLNCVTLPCFGQVQYFAFIARPPGKDAKGNPDDADPRWKGHQIPYDANFRVKDPLISIGVGGPRMLLEGYLRSILWLRNPIDPLQMWIPKP